MSKLSENATLVERIQFYVQFDESRKAKALAQLGDYLEDCFEWEIEFTEGLA